MIEANGLTKRFGPTVAVDGLSLRIRPGRVTGFLGPNGAGKSTTLRMVLGLDRPTAGTVTINGSAYRDLPQPLRQVGSMLDARAVHGGRTAYHHLLWLAHSNGIARRRVGAVLAATGLERVAGRRVKGFSLGMAQRLGIAAAACGRSAMTAMNENVTGPVAGVVAAESCGPPSGAEPGPGPLPVPASPTVAAAGSWRLAGALGPRTLQDSPAPHGDGLLSASVAARPAGQVAPTGADPRRSPRHSDVADRGGPRGPGAP